MKRCPLFLLLSSLSSLASLGTACASAPPVTAAPTTTASAAPPPAPSPSPASAPATKPSCIGPRKPGIDAQTISGMMQGDDEFPMQRIANMAPAVTPVLLDFIKNASTDQLVRHRAINILAVIKCKDTVPALESLLDSSEPLDRLYGATAYGEVAGASGTPRLVQLLDDPDKGVVKFTIKTLATNGDARAISPLEKFAKDNGKADWLRQLATSASQSIKTRSGTP